MKLSRRLESENSQNKIVMSWSSRQIINSLLMCNILETAFCLSLTSRFAVLTKTKRAIIPNILYTECWPVRYRFPKTLRVPEVWSSGQRESFFQSRDENERFSDSISFIETRPRVPDTYSQTSRRDREKISSNLGHRDEIEIYYLHSQASRQEREFP